MAQSFICDAMCDCHNGIPIPNLHLIWALVRFEFDYYFKNTIARSQSQSTRTLYHFVHHDSSLSQTSLSPAEDQNKIETHFQFHTIHFYSNDDTAETDPGLELRGGAKKPGKQTQTRWQSLSSVLTSPCGVEEIAVVIPHEMFWTIFALS